MFPKYFVLAKYRKIIKHRKPFYLRILKFPKNNKNSEEF